MALLLLLSGCCRNALPPEVQAPDALVGEPNTTLEVHLSEWVEDPASLLVQVEPGPGLAADVSEDGLLRVVPEPNWTGDSEVYLQVEDSCGNTADAVVDVAIGYGLTEGDCATTFRYQAQDPDTESVYVAGDFNGWDPQATALNDLGGGAFELELDLDPGHYSYKFVEVGYPGGARAEQWTCDPTAPYQQCDAGYSWNRTCALGDGCNSLLVVPACDQPELALTLLDIDRDANTAHLGLEATAGTMTITVDGETVHSGEPVDTFETGALDDGRHTIRVFLETDQGAAEPLYVPFWTDDRDWQSGLMYYVFVDRFANGDLTLDFAEGTTHHQTDYLGGDWQGVIDRLDYLDELGVTVIWLTAPQDNGSGAWGTSCTEDYSGYHGYWPSDAFGVEEHFGDEELLRVLIDEAHARDMRVLTDWVANHVHEDHPYATDHPEWFNDLLVCQGDVWQTDPEVCWFDSFLPDFKYYDAEPLLQSVDDAVWWVKEYELDGYRVDAVKHMPHSVFFNFQSRVQAEIEHTAVGGDEEFYTVGETFTGDRGTIGAYVNPDELDAQFDFTLYWSILSTLGRGEGSLQDLEGTFADSEAAYDGYLMSTFLGNHDVERFIAHASGEVNSLYGDGACPDGDNIRGPDQSPDWDEPYLRLQLAWTWLLTHEGLPLVYYGDEIGLPGYHDPDNRQMMRWEFSSREQEVFEHVRALGQARQVHPALSTGDRVTWWEESDVLAWARVDGDSEMVAAVNRSWTDRSLDNGLSWAGLTPDSTWEDVLTGQQVTANGDRLVIDLPAMTSVVLVRVD